MHHDRKKQERTELITLVLLVLAIWVLLDGCSPNPPICDAEPEVDGQEAYIIAGNDSVDTRGVVQVHLERASCSGTIVGPHTVLTAAHCIANGGRPVGIWLRGPEPSYWPVLSYTQHERWEKLRNIRVKHMFEADVALLYTLATLPGPYPDIADSEIECYPEMLAQGFGMDEDGLFQGLRERVVIERDHDRFGIEVSEGPCYGDSGGPLWAQDIDGTLDILGVSSFVHDNDCQGSMFPNLKRGSATYTNLLTYGDWVRERIK